jgi:hypothetical protein
MLPSPSSEIYHVNFFLTSTPSCGPLLDSNSDASFSRLNLFITDIYFQLNRTERLRATT